MILFSTVSKVFGVWLIDAVLNNVLKGKFVRFYKSVVLHRKITDMAFII